MEWELEISTTFNQDIFLLLTVTVKCCGYFVYNMKQECDRFEDEISKLRPALVYVNT